MTEGSDLKPNGQPYKTTPAERERARLYREANQEAVREWHRQYRKNNTQKKTAAQRKSRYGVSPERFTAMWTAQEGRCANPGCRVEMLLGGRGPTSVHLDHDHDCCPGGKSCGKCVRALLCGACNMALANTGHTANRLRGLADYIEGHRGC